jgi:hypothetical protein
VCGAFDDIRSETFVALLLIQHIVLDEECVSFNDEASVEVPPSEVRLRVAIC